MKYKFCVKKNIVIRLSWSYVIIYNTTKVKSIEIDIINIDNMFEINNY